MSSSSKESASPHLIAHGWNDRVAHLFAPLTGANVVPGRVVCVYRGNCDVATPTGTIRASTRSVTGADPMSAVCTGDWAAVETVPSPRVVSVLPRSSALVRSTADRTSRQQVLAANVDIVVITISASIPLKNARVERLLAAAWDSGANPVVAVTKADLSDDVQAFSSEVSAAAVGVDVVVTSATTTEGLDALTSTLDGTAVLIGPSGAGKSTLANALLGADTLATGPVRSVDGKGRHTTVHRELRPMPGGGVLIDTPGLRALGVADVGAALENVFSDIDHLAGQCSFRDCTHRTEPGCAVADAVAAGRLAADRLERYRKLKRESDWEAARSDLRATKERKRRDKAIARDQRAMYRFRDRQR